MPSKKKISSGAKQPKPLKIKLLREAAQATTAILRFTGRKDYAEVICDALNLYFLALFAQTRNLPFSIGKRSSTPQRAIDIRDPDMGRVFRALSNTVPCVLVDLIRNRRSAEKYFKSW